jgi:hypothetical protein
MHGEHLSESIFLFPFGSVILHEIDGEWLTGRIFLALQGSGCLFSISEDALDLLLLLILPCTIGYAFARLLLP